MTEYLQTRIEFYRNKIMDMRDEIDSLKEREDKINSYWLGKAFSDDELRFIRLRIIDLWDLSHIYQDVINVFQYQIINERENVQDKNEK